MPSATVRDPLAGADFSPVAGVDRRRSPRVALHWTIYLNLRQNGYPIRTQTRDISKDGFYCLLDQPLTPGERIDCDIVVPIHGSQRSDDVVYLRCDSQVVRVEKIGTGEEFGLACRIEDYRIVHSQDNRHRVEEPRKSI